MVGDIFEIFGKYKYKIILEFYLYVRKIFIGKKNYFI